MYQPYCRNQAGSTRLKPLVRPRSAIALVISRRSRTPLVFQAALVLVLLREASARVVVAIPLVAIPALLGDVRPVVVALSGHGIAAVGLARLECGDALARIAVSLVGPT
jgi:hypothetical protein